MSAPFTYSELGAMLIAIGNQMIERELAYPTTFDGASDEAMKLEIHDQLINRENYDSDTAEEVADRLLELTEEGLREQLQIIN